MLETPIIFQSNQNQLIAIHHHPNEPSDKGVVIVVGGPQTKFGSHRQFVELARYLAGKNVHVFRFDYSGAGDSEGSVKNFGEITQDIDDAIVCFCQHAPMLKNITLWGLCDAASAISMYLAEDYHQKINRVVLLNPWVRQASSEAKVYLRSYYFSRITQKSFWHKLFTGQFNLLTSAKGVKKLTKEAKQTTKSSFIDTMHSGLKNFQGRIHIIQSENDITGKEFHLLVKQDIRWQQLNFSSYDVIDGANHTFSSDDWKRKVAILTLKAVISSNNY